MGLDSMMKVVIVNKYTKFQLNVFDSIEVNFNFNYFTSVKGA